MSELSDALKQGIEELKQMQAQITSVDAQKAQIKEKKAALADQFDMLIADHQAKIAKVKQARKELGIRRPQKPRKKNAEGQPEAG